MAWSKTKPADADLISDSAGDLRNNFTAIEEGSGDFFQDKVVLKEQGSDPSVISNRNLVYAKEVGSQTELFARNDASGDSGVQLTDSGKMGSASTDIWFESFSHDSGTTTYNENNFVTAWGHFQSDGSDLAAAAVNGLSAAKDSTGKYTITFDAAVSSANYLVIGTVVKSPSAPRILTAHTLTTTTFQVFITNDAANLADEAFCVMVLGGR